MKLGLVNGLWGPISGPACFTNWSDLGPWFLGLRLVIDDDEKHYSSKSCVIFYVNTENYNYDYSLNNKKYFIKIK